MEVQSLHRQYVDGAQAQLEGWRDMVLSIQANDAQAFADAKESQQSGATQITTYQSALKAIEAKHKLVHGEQ